MEPARITAAFILAIFVCHPENWQCDVLQQPGALTILSKNRMLGDLRTEHKNLESREKGQAPHQQSMTFL